MFEFLAQMNVGEVAASGAAGAVLTVAVLLIKRGFYFGVGKTSNGGVKQYVTRPECTLMHAGLEKLEEERHNMVVTSINAVTSSVRDLAGRIDDLMRAKP